MVQEKSAEELISKVIFVLIWSCFILHMEAGSTCGGGRYCFSGCFQGGCPCSTTDCSNHSFCYFCGPGKFMDANDPDCGAGNCSLCPSGTYSNGIGLTSADDCTLCPTQTSSKPGSFSSADCSPCPPGSFFDENITNCSLCSPGSFSDQAKSSCSICGAGSFASRAGASICQLCAAGSYAAASGHTECTNCRLGTYWASSAGNCAGSGPLLTCSNGTLGRAAYSGPEDAVWTIAPQGARAVYLAFLALTTAPGADTLVLYACPDTLCATSTLLATLSGPRPPGPLVVPAPAARLHWAAQSPRSNATRYGWVAQWMALEGDARARPLLLARPSPAHMEWTEPARIEMDKALSESG